MTSHFSLAKTLIENSKQIVLTTHEHTDGDDLGTVLALYLHLKNIGKKPILVINFGVPSQLKFLPHTQVIRETLPPNYSPDLIIYSGCSSKHRTRLPELENLPVKTINFDHHPDNTFFGDINIVDSRKSSVAELMYDFFIFCQYPLTPNIATCLLTGIFTDTGSFMHSNTKPSTLHASANLLRHGASLHKISKQTYKNKTPQTLKAWGQALQNAYYNSKKKVIYSVLTKSDITELKDIPLSAFEGFVETLNKVPEAKFALFLKQDGNFIKGSLRSDPHKGINVQEIAKILGGGGHVWASGFTLIGHLEKDSTGKWLVQSATQNTLDQINDAKKFIESEGKNALITQTNLLN